MFLLYTTSVTQAVGINWVNVMYDVYFFKKQINRSIYLFIMMCSHNVKVANNVQIMSRVKT